MKFDIYDVNNDGMISLEELYYMLTDTFSDLMPTKKTDDSDSKIIQKIIKSLSNDIMSKLDEDFNGYLDWNEFKRYLKTE